MKNSAVLSLAIGVLLTSCATEGQMAKELPIVSDWPGSEVFQLPREGGFQWETLELKDGRFRYWFTSDSIGGRAQKYPIKGSYESKGDQLILSSGKTYTVRQLNGVRTLWAPSAMDHWNQFQIIDVYEILLPVQSIKAPKPTLKPLLTKEQWDRSADHVTKVESISRLEPHKWKWKEGVDPK